MAKQAIDPRIVSALCAVGLVMVFLATRVKRMPLPAKVLLAVGGITYPLYLLHMQLGYVLFVATMPHHKPAVSAVIIIAEADFLAWVIWRFSNNACMVWSS